MNLQVKDRAVFPAWLALARPPNLLTVPGDALAGFVVAWPVHTGRLPDLMAAVGAGLFFYMAGLVINDLADMEVDQRERPHRPLASGAISRIAARNVAGFLLAGGLLLAGLQSMALLAAGTVLGGLVLFYNLMAKRNRLAGAVVMGLCRAGSVALGVMAAAPVGLIHPEVLATLAWWLLFIASVTWIAAREMSDQPYGNERWIPLLVVVAGAALFFIEGPRNETMTMRALLCLVFTSGIVWQACFLLGMKPHIPSRDRKAPKKPRYPHAIGQMISALIPMQAGVIVLHAVEPWMMLAGLLVLLAWPVNRWQAKIFAAS